MLPLLVVVGGRRKLPDSFRKPNLLGACISEGGGEHALPSSCCDANGQVIPTMWRASDTSAVSSDILKEWAEKCIIPSFKAHGLSAEKPGILLVGGVQTHCGFELAGHLRQHHVYAFLRSLNTSARLRGEDTTVFPYVLVFALSDLYFIFIAGFSSKCERMQSTSFSLSATHLTDTLSFKNSFGLTSASF